MPIDAAALSRGASAPEDPAVERTNPVVEIASVPLSLLAEGALWWLETETLVVSDLHLEKASAFAARGQMLPPYDTQATLSRLARLMDRLSPARVIALGDSFHDRNGAARMHEADRTRLTELVRRVEWIWVAGNHDPEPPRALGGHATELFRLGALHFRHEPQHGSAIGEIAGHLHPSARLVDRGHSVRRRCFAADRRRMVLPAFGALTGGLNVLDTAFRPLFDGRAFHAFMLGKSVHAIAGRRLADG